MLSWAGVSAPRGLLRRLVKFKPRSFVWKLPFTLLVALVTDFDHLTRGKLNFVITFGRIRKIVFLWCLFMFYHSDAIRTLVFGTKEPRYPGTQAVGT